MPPISENNQKIIYSDQDSLVGIFRWKSFDIFLTYLRKLLKLNKKMGL